jgi:hypothetical protein
MDLTRNVWWTDHTDRETYLHVERHEDGTSHRVWCKHSRDARIAMFCGILYWVWNKGDRPQLKYRDEIKKGKK